MDIYKHTHSSNELEKYKACILLGELRLNAEMLDKIKKDANETNDICRHYLLAKRSGEFLYISRYFHPENNKSPFGTPISTPGFR